MPVSISAELLVRNGLFPENLPSVFTTKLIWPHLAPSSATYALTPKAVGEICAYDASKRGAQRRLFGIPHPLFIRDQGIFFQRHWTEIENCFQKSKGSVSHPIIDLDGSRHVRITPHSDLPRIRLSRLSRFSYCLVADVSRCFYSIYSHSIPWAIHGKAESKSDFDYKSSTIFGNRLDFSVRQAQSRQTMGIPVGPDASKIIAEIVMCAVDQRLIDLCGSDPPTYVRHVDDYWIGGRTYEQCERYLRNLRQALNEFSLDVNELKTRIISAKFIFGETWPSEVERSITRTFGLFNEGDGDAVATLGAIIERAVETNDDGIVKNAIRVIDRNRYWNRDWEIFEHFLAQCAIQFSHSFDYVARVIAWRARRGNEINMDLWVDIARHTAIRDGALGRDSETCWSMWLLKELNSKIPTSITSLITEHSSPLVLAFLAHFPKHRMTTDRKLMEKLRGKVEGDPFSGSFWPLTLELTHLGAGDAAWSQGPTVAALRTLHNNGVSIIDWAAPPRVFETDGGPRVRHPDYAIEDIGSDYADDDEGEDEPDDDDWGL